MTSTIKMIYLDNGATSFPKPPTVAEAMSHFLLKVGGSPGRSGHRLSQEAARVVFECREALARLFGAADARRIAFTLNATQALNTAISGILKPGDRVLTTAMEHNSTMRPLRDLEQRGIIEVEVLPCDKAGRLDLVRLEAALRTRPRLLAAVHASNVSGAIVPLRELGDDPRRRDAAARRRCAVGGRSSDRRRGRRHRPARLHRTQGALRAAGHRRPLGAPGYRARTALSRRHRQQLGARGAALVLAGPSRKRHAERGRHRRPAGGGFVHRGDGVDRNPGARGGADAAIDRRTEGRDGDNALRPRERRRALAHSLGRLFRARSIRGRVPARRGVRGAHACRTALLARRSPHARNVSPGDRPFCAGVLHERRADRCRNRRLPLSRGKKGGRPVSVEPGAFAIATFHSTHMVLKAEKLLKEAGVRRGPPGARAERAVPPTAG